MDYKKYIKNRNTRFKILKLLNWVPDSIMLRIQYRIKMGFWPDFRQPKRFTEKLQLYKMRYRNPVMHQCVDKYEVRKYVESKGLGNILNELYGVYDKSEDIDFSLLQQRFVIKATDGGGGLNVIVVDDKDTADYNDIIGRINLWKQRKKVNTNAGREWAYDGDYRSRIIIEKYLEDREGGGLIDYKFFCFNGEPKFLYVITDRKPGEYAYFGVYDMDFNKLPVYRSDERRAKDAIPKPKNYDEMIEVARKLSTDFPHVRVDLYSVNGNIIFGELTFYDGSGYFHYDPDEFDFEVGSYFIEY